MPGAHPLLFFMPRSLCKNLPLRTQTKRNGMKITEYSIVDMTPDQRCRKHIKLTQGTIMKSCFDHNDNIGGDVLLIRDWLQAAGFEFGKHFYLKKHERKVMK